MNANKDILLKFISQQGYKKDSPDKNRPMNVIPSNEITMKDVEFPVKGTGYPSGEERMMYPGEEHVFPGDDYVVEIPAGYHRMPDGSIMADEDHKYQYGGKKKFQEAGTVDPNLEIIYENFPAMKNMGPVTLKADPEFTRDKTGVGDIEYFTPDPSGRGTIIYPNKFEYSHPDPSKSTHGIVYNPETNNAQSIFLDMLHGMKDSDPNFRKLRNNFKNEMLKFEEEGFERDFLAYVTEAGGIENTDGRTAFMENWVDAKLRNLLFEGTPEDFEKARYWQDAKEVYLSDPKLNRAFSSLHEYLITNKVPTKSSYMLPEVEVAAEKGTSTLEEPTREEMKLDKKYKKGGLTYEATKSIYETKNLLSLLT